MISHSNSEAPKALDKYGESDRGLLKKEVILTSTTTNHEASISLPEQRWKTHFVEDRKGKDRHGADRLKILASLTMAGMASQVSGVELMRVLLRLRSR